MAPKSLALVLIGALAFASALIETLVGAPRDSFNAYTVAELVLLMALIFWWYHVDRTEHGYRSGRLMNAGMLVAVVIALPIYLIRSRGWRRGAIATALAAGFFGLILVLEEAGDWLGGWLAR